MRDESVARRYAAALFAKAQQDNTVDQIDADLETIVMAVEQVPLLRVIIGEPMVTETRKKEALAAAFREKVHPHTLAFLSLLVDKRRIGLLRQIQQEFDRLAMQAQNLAQATAVTAVPLTENEIQSLKAALQARTGKNIELTTEIDPAVIGGVLVRIGDTVLDGTVRGNLNRLRARLLNQ
ncbi:MAG: F0F1 ATP synthase subunit delta [Armatimonadaceae bacterium]